MRHLFIINPISGRKTHDPKKTEEDIKKAMAEYDGEYEIYFTTAPKDATLKVKEEAAKGEELRVYSCGGDGTLNECVNGAVGFNNVAVAPYPCGTGNDFIKCFESEREQFFDIKELIDGQIRPIDIIDCGKYGYGINTASVGIDARIGADVHKYSKLPLVGGAGGYIVSAVINILKGVNQTLKITTDKNVFDGKFALACICNGRYYGGGFNPVPEALPDDGYLDVLIIKEVGLIKIAQLIGKFAKGRYKECEGYITHVKTKSVRIQSPAETLMGYDGEAFYSTDAAFNVLSGGVNMIFPKNMRFFENVQVKEGINV